MGKIIGLGISGVVITVIGLTLRVKVTNISLYFLFVIVGAIGLMLVFYSGKFYGSRR